MDSTAYLVGDEYIETIGVGLGAARTALPSGNKSKYEGVPKGRAVSILVIISEIRVRFFNTNFTICTNYH